MLILILALMQHANSKTKSTMRELKLLNNPSSNLKCVIVRLNNSLTDALLKTEQRTKMLVWPKQPPCKSTWRMNRNVLMMSVNRILLARTMRTTNGWQLRLKSLAWSKSKWNLSRSYNRLKPSKRMPIKSWRRQSKIHRIIQVPPTTLKPLSKKSECVVKAVLAGLCFISFS